MPDVLFFADGVTGAKPGVVVSSFSVAARRATSSTPNTAGGKPFFEALQVTILEGEPFVSVLLARLGADTRIPEVLITVRTEVGTRMFEISMREARILSMERGGREADALSGATAVAFAYNKFVITSFGQAADGHELAGGRFGWNLATNVPI